MFNTVLQFGIPGGPELLVVLLLAVLLFGANKIPKLARSSGQAIGEFQKGREQVEQELEEIKEGDDEQERPADAGTGADPTPTDTSAEKTDAEPATETSNN